MGEQKAEEIGAAKFKAECLSILDNLGSEGVVITKHGKPVARLLPMPKCSSELIGSMSEEIWIVGDLMSTGVEWEANAQS